MHGAVEGVGKRIEYLRRQYASEKVTGPPRFEDEETRLAYAVSYHPAHAFAYLHLLLRRGLGELIFGDLLRPPKVMVLGAGVGAETLAMMRWAEDQRIELLAGARFVLVDRASWRETRRAVLAPTVRTLWAEHKVVFDEVTADLATPSGREFVLGEAGHADVIFCPSVLSEMISEHAQDGLLSAVREAISPTAKLVLIDHKDPEFEHVSRQWSRQFGVLSQGSTPGVVIPQPSPWVRAHLLTGANHRIPTRSYPMAWSVLARG